MSAASWTSIRTSSTITSHEPGRITADIPNLIVELQTEAPLKRAIMMQFSGARVNLAKTLLYAINGGRDEISGKKGIDLGEPVQTDALDFDDVWERFDAAMTWLADTYVNALDIIHYMHDKYAYERLEMALHDYDPSARWRAASPGVRSWPTRCRRSSTQVCTPCAMTPG